MTSKLYIADKGIAYESNPVRHLYIVYDPDGVLNSGDERIIRGGPADDPSKPIEIEIGMTLLESQDGQNNNASNPYPSLANRHFTLIAEGSLADDRWSDMIDFAQSLVNTSSSLGTTRNADIGYGIVKSNSNSVINSVMAAIGLDVDNYRAVRGGDVVEELGTSALQRHL